MEKISNYLKTARLDWKEIDWRKVLNDAGITKIRPEKNGQIEFFGGKDKDATYILSDNQGEFNLTKIVHFLGSIPYSTSLPDDENYKKMSSNLRNVLKHF